MYGYPFHKTIEILGEGTVSATPDRALVVLGVISEGSNLQAIQSENSLSVSNIIHSLLNQGIPREKMQTHDYRIEVLYDYPDGKQIFRGYKITHLLQITIDNVDQVGNLVNSAVSTGANEVSSIRFIMAHPEIYENQALSLAIQNARQKALTIANTLGVTLAASPYYVKELSRTAEPPSYMTSKMAVSAAAPPIQPGQLTLHAMVRVWFLFT